MPRQRSPSTVLFASCTAAPAIVATWDAGAGSAAASAVDGRRRHSGRGAAA